MRCPCHCSPLASEPEPRGRRRRGLFSAVFQLLLLYGLLVYGGGTLINTGHPVAVELGRLLHVVTFVDPAIRWADGSGFELLASGLETVSHGFPIG